MKVGIDFDKMSQIMKYPRYVLRLFFCCVH